MRPRGRKTRGRRCLSQNQHYPRTGCQHKVVNMGQSGASSAWHIERLSEPQRSAQLANADMVIVDTALNDVEELHQSQVGREPCRWRVVKGQGEASREPSGELGLLWSVSQHAMVLFLYLPHHLTCAQRAHRQLPK